MKISFYPAHTGVKKTSILLYVRHGAAKAGLKTQFKINTGISGINPSSPKKKEKDWNYTKQRLNIAATDSDIHNKRLDEIIAAANAVKNSLPLGNDISIHEIEKRIKEAIEINITDTDNSEVNKTNLIARYNQFIEYKKLSCTASTVNKLTTSKQHLENFAKHNRLVLSFENIDSNFYDNLQVYFIQEKKFGNRTANKIISHIAAFLRWSVEKNYSNLNVNKKIKRLPQTIESDVIFLEEDELFTLYNADYSQRAAWDSVRDAFCFMCFTGQRFSDIEQMKRDDIKGNVWTINQKKTLTRVQIPLNEYAREILEKYKHLSRPLPVISGQKTNETLKLICEKLKFNEIVTRSNKYGANVVTETGEKWKFMSTHIGRKTWVTLSLLKGMNIEEVMKISGHSNYASMQPYIKVTDNRVTTAMNDIWNRNVMNTVPMKVVS